MDDIFLVKITCLILLLGTLLYYAILNVGLSFIREKSVYDSSLQDLLSDLEGIMDIEMQYSVELPFEGKDIKRITNFEEVLVDLTTGTTNSLSPTFMARIEACGHSEDWVYEYITRGCTVRLLSFMEKNNGGYIPEETNEEETKE